MSSTFGFQMVWLDGGIELKRKSRASVVWTPSPMAQAFLASAPLHQWGNRVVQDDAVKSAGWKPGELAPVLCRLRVRSAHVWARDPQRAADLDLFFYLRAG